MQYEVVQPLKGDRDRHERGHNQENGNEQRPVWKGLREVILRIQSPELFGPAPRGVDVLHGKEINTPRGLFVSFQYVTCEDPVTLEPFSSQKSQDLADQPKCQKT